MKKNISFIPMDSALETWLLEKLMKEPPESDCAEDLLSGIRDMLNGEVSSLLLSSSNETEAPVPVPLDGMRLGELEIYPKGRRARFLLRNRSIGQSGRRITFWMTATSWRLSESYGRKLSLTRTRQSTF